MRVFRLIHMQGLKSARIGVEYMCFAQLSIDMQISACSSQVYKCRRRGDSLASSREETAFFHALPITLPATVQMVRIPSPFRYPTLAGAVTTR